VGHFSGVSKAFLDQTLSKQVISHLRARLSYQVGAIYLGGDVLQKNVLNVCWSPTGRLSHQNAEKERMGYNVRRGGRDAAAAAAAAAAGGGQRQAGPSGDKDVARDDISLVESGACGAFVHGLEDEFEVVRFAAIGMAFRKSGKLDNVRTLMPQWYAG